MFNFEHFDEEQLTGCTYRDAQRILKELEEVCITITDNADMVVELDSYIYVATYLRDSAEDNMFPDFDYDSSTASAELELFLSRLISIKLNFVYYKRIKELALSMRNETTASLEMIDMLSDGVKNSESEVSSKINNISQKIDSFNAKMDTYKAELAEQQKNLTQQKETTKASLKRIKRENENSFQAQMKETERSTLTNMLTLLGVFSAVIVTIMSAVITSGSWLDNADNSDAILAFIVPAGTIIIAIITLLSFVYAFQYNSLNKATINTEQNAGNGRGKNIGKNPMKGLFITSGIVAVGLGILIVSLWLLQRRECKAIHTRYIMPIAECPVKMNEEEELVYRIVYNDKEHDFPCEKAITHGDNLHFCIIHEVLE